MTHIRRLNLGTVTIACLVVVWFLLLRPTALAGPASYIFVSGSSMLPTLETGDLVLLQRADEYAEGDIIAFEIPEGSPGAGALVIHRIVGGNADDGFVMQGDNKPAPDEWRPTREMIAGHLWLRVPGAGKVVAWLRQPGVFAPLVAGLVVFFILLGGGDPKRNKPTAAKQVVGTDG